MSTNLEIKKGFSLTQLRPQLWQIIGMLALIAYFGILNVTNGFAQRHLFLGIVVFGILISGKDRARQFLIDWVPLLLFWVVYDLLRAIALDLLFRVQLHTPYNFDIFFFGWMFGGKVPAHWLTDWYKAHDGETLPLVIFTYCSFVYTVHFMIFPLYMLIQWINRRREIFYIFSISFALLHLATVITYIVYPAAPPWYIYDYKFAAPTAEYAKLIANVPHGLLQSLWRVSPNYFAAVPSLHGAYPTMLLLLLRKKSRLVIGILVFYLASTWFATLFLNHHFIFDLLVGAAYALGCVLLTEKVIYPRLVEPRLRAKIQCIPETSDSLTT